MTRWLRAHPVAGFITLAFAISYLVGMPVLMAVSGMIPAHAHITRAYLPRILVTYGPALAAIALAGARGGRDGIRTMLGRLAPSGADVPWAAFVLAAGLTCAALALMIAGYAFDVQRRAVRDQGGLLAVHLALQIVVIAAGEELGWRGWLLPELLGRTTRLGAALGVGAVWGLWHFPLLLAGPLDALLFMLGAMGLSVLFARLTMYRGGRLPVVVLAHATVNAPLYFWEQITRTSGDASQLQAALQMLEITYAAVALALVAAGWRWWSAREPLLEEVAATH